MPNVVDAEVPAVYAAPARIVMIRAVGTDDTPTVTSELLALARARATDPSIFDERPPFLWGCEISNTRLDSYFTHMSHRTTLPNFAQDATRGNGVSFQNSHIGRALGLGRSLRGNFIGAQGNGVARTLADFYTVAGLRLNDISTTDFIDGVRSGVIGDVSVGFNGGEFICDLCGRDMLTDWDCPHIPGFHYNPEKLDDWRPDPTGVLCTATIENAHLSEVSAVFDGATPGAAIQKAYLSIERGQLPDHQRNLLEQRYRIRLPVRSRSHAGASVPPKETPMPAADSEQFVDLSAFRSVMTAAGVPDTVTDPLAAIRWLGQERERLLPMQSQLVALEGLTTELETLRGRAKEFEQLPALKQELDELRPLAAEVRTLRPLKDEVARLKPLAEELEASRSQIADGKSYRRHLIDEALAAGVRAFGQDWKTDVYKPVLEAPGLPIDTLRQMKTDWERLGDERFPSGTRTNREETPPAEKDKEQSSEQNVEFKVPNSAYAGV